MDIKYESATYFPRCKCCLEDGLLKELWAEYCVDGEFENYGEMLKECYAFNWHQPYDGGDELICESCIERVRQAYNFKKEILASEQVLIDANLFSGDAMDTDLITKDESQPDVQDEYQEIEYLEEEYNVEDTVKTNDGVQCTEKGLKNCVDPVLKGDLSTDEASKKYNIPKKLLSAKAYKKKIKSEPIDADDVNEYTDSDLRKCIKAVLSRELTKDQAAKVYNVPRKLLTSKILTRGGNIVSSDTLKQSKFIDEVKLILAFTTATPFQTKTSKLYCFYCPDKKMYDDPEELRHHNALHELNRLDIDDLLKYHWLNEILKMDIYNFKCSVCDVVFGTWNHMFEHMQEVHDIVFEQAYSRVIPFSLGPQICCGLCNKLYSNYTQLDEHMNSHYSNHICSECGDTFLSESRLKKHAETHKNGQFPCDHCGKTFTLHKYRQKHIKYVHNKDHSIRCNYCQLIFDGEFARHVHILECHKDKVKIITCELCGKTFQFRPYYLKHMRRSHRDNKQCNVCGKSFKSKWELNYHESEHRGQKLYSCKRCVKRYSSAISLSQHYIKLHNERRPMKQIERDSFIEIMSKNA